MGFRHVYRVRVKRRIVVCGERIDDRHFASDIDEWSGTVFMLDDQRPISEMRNLGPACEAHLNAAGIFTAGDVIRLGIEETYERMVAAQMKAGKRVVIHPGYLYAFYGALEDCDWRKVPQSKKNEFKAMCDRLRRKHLGG